MIERKILQRFGPEGKNVALKSTMETLIVFASSIIWSMVDSYYITLMFVLSMVKNKSVEASSISKKV